MSRTGGTSGSVRRLERVFVVSAAMIVYLPSMEQPVTVCRMVRVPCSKSMASQRRPMTSLRRNP